MKTQGKPNRDISLSQNVDGKFRSQRKMRLIDNPNEWGGGGEPSKINNFILVVSMCPCKILRDTCIF